MSPYIIFTENYEKGGGNKYLIDIVNSINNKPIIIVSNKKAIFAEDLLRLKKKVGFYNPEFITRSLLVNKLKNIKSSPKIFFSALFVAFEPIFLIYNIFLFFFFLKKLKPQKVIACNGGYPAAQAVLAFSLAARMHNIPVLMSVVSMPKKRRSPVYLYDLFLDKILWKSLNIIIVNAHAIGLALINLRGAPKSKITIIHNGIKNIKIQKHKIIKRPFTIGFVGRLEYAKGITYLLDAFLELAHSDNDINLTIVGSGDLLEYVSEKINQLNASNRVKILGHYEGEISKVFNSFDLFVFPSLWEGLPYSIIEAMRAQCPIVSTNVGGISEALINNKSAILISPRSISDIVAAVKTLKNNNKKRNAMAREARLRFETFFNLSLMQTKVRSLVDSV